MPDQLDEKGRGIQVRGHGYSYIWNNYLLILNILQFMGKLLVFVTSSNSRLRRFILKNRLIHIVATHLLILGFLSGWRSAIPQPSVLRQ